MQRETQRRRRSPETTQNVFVSFSSYRIKEYLSTDSFLSHHIYIEMSTSQSLDLPQLIISLRGKKCDDFVWNTSTIVSDVKFHLSKSNVGQELGMQPSDIKLIHKGKILSDDSANIYNILLDPSKKVNIKKPIRLMAMGVSATEAKRNQTELHEAKSKAPRVRDDLSAAGRADIAARQRLGRKMLNHASKKESKIHSKKYGFHCIETLPMLPEQQKAKEILQSLANDPGILACMEKHQWNVGCLAELYPEGKVGESEVCVMGLNQNKGQKILLRLRTDDLKGFRKILNIRKVLFHELAHNVHSEHDGKFFQLMRQVEKECNELDWTRDGHVTGGISHANSMDVDAANDSYTGGTYVLGSADSTRSQQMMSTRELAARAAMMRLTAEEQEIQEACGCYEEQPIISESRTTAKAVEDDEMSSAS
jgi:hypothetical protein